MADAQQLVRPEPPPDRRGRDGLGRAPWGPLEIIAALLLTLLALAVIFVANYVILSALDVPVDKAQDDPTGATVLLLGQAVLDLCAVAAAASLSLGKFHLGPRAWGLRRTRPFAPGQAAMALIAAFIALGIYQAIVSALGLADLKANSNVPESLFDQRTVLPFTILLVVIIAPITEEMFFRGFVFNGLRRRLGTLGAAAMSGLLFAAIHINSSDLIGIFVPFTVIGFVLAVLVARTGSLWNSILVHFSFNLLGTLGAVGDGGGAGAALLAIVALYMALAALNRARWGDSSTRGES